MADRQPRAQTLTDERGGQTERVNPDTAVGVEVAGTRGLTPAGVWDVLVLTRLGEVGAS